jgi:hypothetical protein
MLGITEASAAGELAVAMAQRTKAAVITVGDGRGFVIARGGRRLVITAAHCLSTDDSERLPIPCIGASLSEERTFKELLAPLGSSPSVWTECLFADPIADLAVLGPPDEAWPDEATAYDALTKAATPIKIADTTGAGFMLSLDGRWFGCTVEHVPNWFGAACPLWLTDLAEAIQGGMSGSPIISAAGAAIGVIGTASDRTDEAQMGARLAHHLPGRLLAPVRRVNRAPL